MKTKVKKFVLWLKILGWTFPIAIFAIVTGFYIASRERVEPVDTSKLAVVKSSNELTVEEIFRLVNAERYVRNLPELEMDPNLTALARERARDMSLNNYYSHTDSEGRSFDDLFSKYRISSEYACENLGLEFTHDETVFLDSWLQSTEGHRECLLNPDVGIAGYAIGKLKNGPGFDNYIVVGIHATN